MTERPSLLDAFCLLELLAERSNQKTIGDGNLTELRSINKEDEALF